MLTMRVIGPGRNGNYLAGYFRPCSRVFVPLYDCNTREQAEEARRQLDRESVQRNSTHRSIEPDTWQPVRGFYDDE